MAGLFNAYRAGNVTLANAFGTGVADDKALYAYVPAIIKLLPFSEDPILKNVETFLMTRPKERQHVLANLDKLVVKAVGESGGYGMLIGPHNPLRNNAKSLRARSKQTRGTTLRSRRSRSRGRRASSAMQMEPRHVDLRPYVLYGDKVTIVPGGLTRVALKQWIARCELVAGRGQQGYLGAERSRWEETPMLSRVADSLYWMSRYLERAEHTTRLLDVNLNLMLDEGPGERGPAMAAGCCWRLAQPKGM